MEKMKIVGRRKLDFTANGNQVQGIQLFVTHAQPYVEGVMGEKIFVGTNKPFYDKCTQYPIGSEVEITFNRYGKPEDIVLSVTGK